MFCPKCGSEYVDGITRCEPCGVPLVEEQAARPTSVDEPVVVFASGRAELVAIAKSILLSAEIPFAVRGEDVQDLFGWGRFPAGTNLFIGPMQLVVTRADAEDATQLLAGLDRGDCPELASVEQVDAEEPNGSRGGRMRGLAKVVAGFVLFVFAGELLWALLALVIGLLVHE